MSESKPRELGEQQTLWSFRDFAGSRQTEELLEEVRRRGRVERWGHAAQIPVFAGGDDIVMVVDGNVVVERDGGDDSLRLTRGDAFGKTPKGRVASSTGPMEGHQLQAVRETTISTVERDVLRQIWDDVDVRLGVEAGGWFRKTRLEVPVWPLVGTMPTTRLARVLLHLVEQYGTIDGDRGRLPVAMKPGELAGLAGIQKHRAADVWSLFERTGLVSVDGDAVILEQLETLRNYALS